MKRTSVPQTVVPGTRTARRRAALARRRRLCLSAWAIVVLVTTMLLSGPRVTSFSAYEDPRPGGISVRVQLGARARSAEPQALPQWQQLSGDLPGPGEPGGKLAAGASDHAAADSVAAGGPVWHIVQPGDNLSTIGERYDVSVSDLWIANRLLNPHALQPGQSLLIPSGPDDVFGFHGPGTEPSDETAEQPPAYHAVRAGENLWTIARRYGVTVTAIRTANSLPTSGLISPGEMLEIPGAERSDASGTAAILRLEWPVFGTISSPFGMRSGKMHQGLDIAADRGTPIRTAAAGRVTSAGWMGNYGSALIIDHGNGMSTLYAHCDELLVARGERVQAGQLIARVGSTGRSTGPHLHFEVILHGSRIDPLRYLLAG